MKQNPDRFLRRRLELDPEEEHESKDYIWKYGPVSISLYSPNWPIAEAGTLISQSIGKRYPRLVKKLSLDAWYGESFEKEGFKHEEQYDDQTKDFPNVGIINLDMHGEDTKKSQGESRKAHSPSSGRADIVSAWIRLTARAERALHALAAAVESGEPVSRIEYFMGFSRLASAFRPLGFEIFETDPKPNNPEDKEDESDENNETKLVHSQRLATEAYIRSGMDPEKAEKLVLKHAPAIAVITREQLLERYGSRSA